MCHIFCSPTTSISYSFLTLRLWSCFLFHWGHKYSLEIIVLPLPNPPLGDQIPCHPLSILSSSLQSIIPIRIQTGYPIFYFSRSFQPHSIPYSIVYQHLCKELSISPLLLLGVHCLYSTHDQAFFSTLKLLSSKDFLTSPRTSMCPSPVLIPSPPLTRRSSCMFYSRWLLPCLFQTFPFGFEDTTLSWFSSCLSGHAFWLVLLFLLPLKHQNVPRLGPDLSFLSILSLL